MKKLLCLLPLFAMSCKDSMVSEIGERSWGIAPLVQEYWEFQTKEFPLFASASGINHYNDQLGSFTEEDHKRRYDYYVDLLSRTDEIQNQKISLNARIDLELLKFLLNDHIAEYEFKAYLNPILVDAGFHISFSFLPGRMPFKTVKDFENYIQRLKLFPEYARQHIDLMRTGIDEGIIQPSVILDGYDVTYNQHIVDDPIKSLFYRPFERIPSHITDEQRSRLEEEGKSAISDGVVTGYQLIRDFFENEYYPVARQTIGASELPMGNEFYQQRVSYFTTTDLTPKEIHEIGLSEVSRIRSEMEDIIAKVGFDGSFKEFLNFLRTDPGFYAKTPEELLKQASYLAKKADAQLPTLFELLPRQPYGVAPVPDHLAPKYTGGRYVDAPISGTEPGYYWVNTYNLPSRTLYTLEALTLHEAVPGHHLQGALSQELEGLHPFRQNLYISAFGEGWGLYSEFLGQEMGFYSDPYSDFGRLTYEMWRACRLVVDTGIHAFGWSRKQVLDYLAENTALSLHEVRTETDRYISWPGQALAYKIGELKIKELRKKAEEALQEKFDIRQFHNRLLSQGTVTLPILELMIDQYIREKLGNSAAQ